MERKWGQILRYQISTYLGTYLIRPGIPAIISPHKFCNNDNDDITIKKWPRNEP